MNTDEQDRRRRAGSSRGRVARRRTRRAFGAFERLEDRTLLAGDRFEPNNTSLTASPLGTLKSQVYMDTLSITAGDEDWFQLTTTTTGTADNFILVQFDTFVSG